MKIAIVVEIVIPQGLTEEDVKSRWTNNKVTHHVANLIESSAIGQVEKIETKEVK